MNRIKQTTAATKKFVAKHKTKLAVAATATGALYLHCKVVGQHNDFLREHGLHELFYHPEEA